MKKIKLKVSEVEKWTAIHAKNICHKVESVMKIQKIACFMKKNREEKWLGQKYLLRWTDKR